MKDFSLIVEVFGADEVCRVISALSIGLLTSVRSGLMSLEEAEQILFTPRTEKVLRDKGVSPVICELVLECCELEGVLSLLPHRYEENIDMLIEKFSGVLSSICAPDMQWKLARLR
ncbi:DUF3969 family protein [Pseudomonas protegens]|uniref:DUF3969 family protein n=1 Tax=Pseudomonas protegens TaxID=380021 RepID=UPI002777E654|nr:DUF3969 family protein [Pseudomonas protegens]MDP9502469.1 DUF3969 family protein [Pseudomonas protegens]